MKLDFERWLRDFAQAGFFISGSSGLGKSQLMRLILFILAKLSNQAVILLDPHGDLVREVTSDLSTLPKSVRDRVVIVRPCDVNRIVGLNPLSVPRHGSDIRWRARLASKCKHVAYILLRAWGETDFNSKPVLYKWTFRLLYLLALASLPLAAIRYFFDPTHPVYRAMLKFAPDFITRMEMEELAELRPKDREDIIASTKNRFLGFLSNPIIELCLSQRDEDGVLSVQELIQRKAIVLISLEPGDGGELHESDVEILANLWLSEIAFAIWSTPAEKRVPCTVLIDELPTYFKSSFPLLQRLMPTTRKTMCRWVCACQGAFTFPDNADDKLLNLMIGQCGVHFLFGHRNFKDSEFFGKVAKFATVDVHQRKHVEKSYQQTTVGYDIALLEDEGENWSDSSQRGETKTTGETESSQEGRNHGENVHPDELKLRRAVSDATSEMSGRSSHQSNSNNWSATKSQGGSRTRKQTLVPRLKTHVVKNITYMTVEEQFQMVASLIAGLGIGRCIINIGGKGAWIVQLPMLKNRYQQTPKYMRTLQQQLLETIYKSPIYKTEQIVIQRRDEFALHLVQHLNSINNTPIAGSQTLLIQAEPERDNNDDFPFVTI